MARAEQGRDTSTGRYVDTKLDKLCTCGHRLGVHSAARVQGEQPCFSGETGDPCECESFTKPPRRTQRIPREQRKRRAREVTLGVGAQAVLDALPKGCASSYVESAVLEKHKREQATGGRKRG